MFLEQSVDLLFYPLAVVGLVRRAVGLVDETRDVVDVVDEIEELNVENVAERVLENSKGTCAMS